MTSFVLGTRSAMQAQVIDRSHPPVVRALQALADNGEIRYGTIVELDENDLVIPWDGVGVPAGVLVETIDTAAEVTSRVLVHGTVKQDSLLVGVAAATAEQIAALEAIGIWANQGEL